jgi:lipopolysaccharide transport system ATP-binding protein
MYMKLAFAVAAHLEPEILVVDEVLAVGDVAFQKKCLGKMREVGRDGRTVLLVSHNMPSIVNLCQRAMLIEKGKVVVDGPVSGVVERYLASNGSKAGEVVWDEPAVAPGNDLVRMHAVRVYQKKGLPTEDIAINKDVFFELDYWVLRGGEWVYPVVLIKDTMGTHLLSTFHHNGVSLTRDPWAHRPHPVGLYRSTCCIPGNLLNDRTYVVHVHIGKDNVCQVELEDVLRFHVHDTGSMGEEYLGTWAGPLIRPRLAWSTELLE